MKCAVCIALHMHGDAITVVNGTAVCREHLEWVGLSRSVSSRIRRLHEEKQMELKRQAKEIV